MFITDRADITRIQLSEKLNSQQRSQWGQFLTPAPLARFMAAQFSPLPDRIRLLAPGAGVVIDYSEKDLLVLIEAVTSHGPVNLKRRNELTQLFQAARQGLVFVTAFPSRKEMTRYLAEISWETEVWLADQPTHMIHFNGERFLGPYEGDWRGDV